MHRRIYAIQWSIDFVRGHGRFTEPPSRATMWRYGWDTPVDYNDNQLFCGGFDASSYMHIYCVTETRKEL
jgi:hypothetical protein